jgi:hypothetical protein
MVARGKRPRRLNFGVWSRSLTMFIETAANAQELNAAIERIADAVEAFILLCVHAKARRGEVVGGGDILVQSRQVVVRRMRWELYVVTMVKRFVPQS